MNNIELGSLKAKADRLQRIVIHSDEEFVLEIKRSGTMNTVCEAVIGVKKLDYRPNDGKSGLELMVVNLNPIPEYATRVTYCCE